MSNVKERILGALTVMSEADAEKVWELIQTTFILSNAKTATPSADEIHAINAYRNGDPEYSPYLSQDELMKKLKL